MKISSRRWLDTRGVTVVEYGILVGLLAVLVVVLLAAMGGELRTTFFKAADGMEEVAAEIEGDELSEEVGSGEEEEAVPETPWEFTTSGFVNPGTGEVIPPPSGVTIEYPIQVVAEDVSGRLVAADLVGEGSIYAANEWDDELTVLGSAENIDFSGFYYDDLSGMTLGVVAGYANWNNIQGFTPNAGVRKMLVVSIDSTTGQMSAVAVEDIANIPGAEAYNSRPEYSAAVFDSDGTVLHLTTGDRADEGLPSGLLIDVDHSTGTFTPVE